MFELLDGIDLELGGEVQGALAALGGEQLLYLPTGETFQAYGQTGLCNKSTAITQSG